MSASPELKSADRVARILDPLWAGRCDHLRSVTNPSPDNDVADRAAQAPDLFLIAADDNSRVSPTAAAVIAAAGRLGRSVSITRSRDDLQQLSLRIRELESQLVPSNAAVRLWRFVQSLFIGNDRGIRNEHKVELDRLRAELVSSQPNADLVLVPDANHFTKTELREALSPGQSWILLGSTQCYNGHNNAFADLWRVLHRETWTREGDRLCCRLLFIADDKRHELSCESVADAPEIELRIHQPAGGAPQLAEVVFPPETTLHQAKDFIARHLDEWPIELSAVGLRWSESPEQVVACAGCQNRHTALPAEPEPGVRELIAERPATVDTLPWFTCGFEFDRAAGWNREKAQQWVGAKLAGRDLGRTARLTAGQ
jgi:hypothetical protein